MTLSNTWLLQPNERFDCKRRLDLITLSNERNLDAFSDLLYNPSMSEKKEQKMPFKDQARDDRLKAALKSNLAKRKAQAKVRNKKKKLDSMILTEYLDKYAETGKEYVKILQQIIRQNDLTDFDDAKLLPSSKDLESLI